VAAKPHLVGTADLSTGLGFGSLADLHRFVSLLVEMTTYPSDTPPTDVQRRAAAEAVARFDADIGKGTRR